MSCRLPVSCAYGILQERILEWVSKKKKEYWSGFLFPSPGDLPDPGIEPGSLALQADSLPSKPLEKNRQREKYHNKNSLKAKWN